MQANRKVATSPDSPSVECTAQGPEARRRLLRRGLGITVPVAASLMSGPVSAGACLKPSGFASLTTFNSRHPTGMNNCQGKTPAQWLALTTWPSGVDKTTAKFNAIFGSGTSFTLTGDPLLTAVLGQTFGASSVAAVAPGIVALWLDAQGGFVGSPAAFTTTEIVSIWQNISTNLGYKPTVGATWTLQQTVDWITRSWT